MTGVQTCALPILDRVWGSVFSYSKENSLRTWPRRLRYPITVTFGPRMDANASAAQVRQAVVELGADAFPHRKTKRDTLPERFLQVARKRWGQFAMADSTGRELTYGRLAVASVLLSDWTKRSSRPGEHIGVVSPSTCGGAIVNIGILLAGRVPVNLNFTAGREAMQSAIEQCGMRTILTSKVFLAKAKLEQEAGMVFLEDILKSVTGIAKLWGLLRARLAPVASLVARRDPDAPATVLFSSGSTSLPKGIVLSHFNVVSNCDAVLDRKSTRLNSSHIPLSRMPSSA